MTKVSFAAAAAGLVVFPLLTASCVTPKDDDGGRKPVGPTSSEDTKPWNTPISGQGGGVLSAMPKTPRR